MMIKSLSSCSDNVSFPWESNGKISVKGYIYIDGERKAGKNLFYLFDKIDNEKEFLSLLSNLNGFFSVIVESENFVYAAVDRISSTPLMYKIDTDIIIGDNFENFVGKGCSIDEECLVQYLSSGYVYDRKTLIKGVFQLLPGTAVFFDKRHSIAAVESYYEYLPDVKKGIESSEYEYIRELDRVHELVFGRLVDNLNGRQAVLPLSGGYDSRLILEMLLRFNYRNVLCVTWGRETDWQAQIARDVTSKLGVDWVCINQDAENWERWYREGGIEEQMKHCGALCSIPYIQENVLIKYLEANDLIDCDAIFLNGNSGDFIEGQHIPGTVNENMTNDEVVSLIGQKHLRLSELSNPERTNQILWNQVQEFRDRGLDIRLFFEYWEWSERQSKFVSNCIKPFETEGYEWRMPFWENEIMDFWANIPVEMKSGRKLFYSYFERYMNVEVVRPNPVVPRIKVLYERLTDQRFGIFLKKLYGWDRFLNSTPIMSRRLFAKYKCVNPEKLLTVKINSLVALYTASVIEERASGCCNNDS